MVRQKKQQWKRNISETLQKINNETATKGNQLTGFPFFIFFEPTNKITQFIFRFF